MEGGEQYIGVSLSENKKSKRTAPVIIDPFDDEFKIPELGNRPKPLQLQEDDFEPQAPDLEGDGPMSPTTNRSMSAPPGETAKQRQLRHQMRKRNI